MTFVDIVRFEWRYHTRRLPFAFVAAFFAFFGYLLTSGPAADPEININAAYSLAYSIGLLSLVGVFVVTLFCAQSVLRDSEHRMAEIVYTTGVSKTNYLFGHFLGMTFAACSACAFALPGMMLGTLSPRHDPSVIGAFDALDYLSPFVLFVVPNLVIAGAILFFVSALLRITIATYVCGAAIYMLYLLAAMYTGSPLIAQSLPPTPEGLALAAKVDPFGLSALFEQTHYWTPIERNDQRVDLVGLLLINRVAWLAFSFIILACLHRLFAFRLPTSKQPVHPEEASVHGAQSYRPLPASAPGFATFASALVSTVRLEVRQVIGRWPFAVLTLLWVGMCGIQIVEFIHKGEFGTALMPMTAIVIDRIREPLIPIGIIVLIYYSAELIWRERVLGCDPIVDATRASSAVFLMAKTIVLTSLIGVLTIVASWVGVVVQVFEGHTELNLLVYGAQLYFIGLPLALIAVLATLCQVMAPNRYVGMLMTVAAVAFLHFGAFAGPQHPLVRYAALPHVGYTPMAGFGPGVTFFHPMAAYWTIVAMLLGLFTYGGWKRGADDGLRSRLRAMRRRWRPSLRRVALALVAVLALLGGSIFYQTNVVNAYETQDDANRWRAEYERTYRHLEDAAQPTLTHMGLTIDLEPAARRYRIVGRYRMENLSDTSIDSVYFSALDDVVVENLSLDGRMPSTHDERFSVFTFALESPLPPGASSELAYTITVDRSAMPAGGVDADIMNNGSFVLSRTHLPRMGYRSAREITDPVRRAEYGLPPNERPQTIEHAQQLMGASGERDAGLTFDITISTSEDQIPLAPGTQVSTWTDGGRRYARFVMDRPVHALLGYVSARYAVERVVQGDVSIEVFHHPGHDTNVPRFLEAAAAALTSLERRFGPYPHDHLRLVEVPSGRPFTGMAAGGTLYFVETGGFLTDLRDPARLDIVTKRVAHEVAHQWWGGRVRPATGPGSSTLVETTARYAELIVLDQQQGPDAVVAALSFELDRYLSGRARQKEVPLYQAQSEPFLFYSKGALIMMAIRDLIGEEAVDQALRGLVDRADDASLSSLDLVGALRAATPPSQHDLIDQWWKEIVLYDLRIDNAEVEPLGDGRFRLRIHAFGGKHAIRGDASVPLPMDEVLQIGIYDRFPRTTTAHAGLIHSASHRVSGTTTIEMVVDAPPRYVAIDPFLRRIDRNRIDNIAEIESFDQPSSGVDGASAR